ncbi:MAG: glucoamylase family protein [Bacteroidota bacterium]|nr:glucoamylase family protein [Bacteroidota bacterium]
MRKNIFIFFALCSIFSSSFSQAKKNTTFDPFLDTLEQRTFKYFWETVNHKTGLTPDRYPTLSFSSIAAIGFSLTAYGIGAERGYVPRDSAAQLVLTTLQTLWNLPQGDASKGNAGYHGFFYHFLTFDKGDRFGDGGVDLSSIDTGLLMSGILFTQSYFDRDTKTERDIRACADSLYRRVQWNWMQPRPPLIAMGWYPEKGFHHLDWAGFDEAPLLYFLALGSPTFPVRSEAWETYTGNFLWVQKYGYEYIDFDVMFWNQFTSCWFDLRGIQDSYIKAKGIDYFENYKRATYAHREYCIENPKKFIGYSELLWGLSACDGPADETLTINGNKYLFHTYSARGKSTKDFWTDDGTITPYSAGASLPFAPEICIPTLKAIRFQIPGMWTEYGFKDAFNLTYITKKTPHGWVDVDYLGIDQGPMLIMLENYRSGLVWETMKKNPYVINGLARAGFTGGWLKNKE